MLQYVQGVFANSVPTTIGAAFFTHRLIVGGTRYKLQLWDTAGQERFRSMAPMYYRNARVALLVYDVTSRASFAELETWISELRSINGPGILLAIVGNKCDLEARREVPRVEAEAFSLATKALYLETSATDHPAVEEVFLRIVEALSKAGIAAGPEKRGVDPRGPSIDDKKCCG